MAEPPFVALPRPLRLYLWAFAVVCLLFVGGALAPFLTGWRAITPAVLGSGLIFLALNAAGARTRIQLRGEVVQSLDTTIQFAMIVLFPPPFPLLVGLGAAVITWIASPRRGTWTDQPLYKRLFNLGHTTLTIGAASLAAAGHFAAALPPLLAILAAYLLADVLPIVIVVALSRRLAPWEVWWRFHRPGAAPELAAATTGILAAIAWRFDPLALGLVILPVAALLWAFRTSDRAKNRAAAQSRRGDIPPKASALGSPP